jgi:hypothetical protein
VRNNHVFSRHACGGSNCNGSFIAQFNGGDHDGQRVLGAPRHADPSHTRTGAPTMCPRRADAHHHVAVRCRAAAHPAPLDGQDRRGCVPEDGKPHARLPEPSAAQADTAAHPALRGPLTLHTHTLAVFAASGLSATCTRPEPAENILFVYVRCAELLRPVARQSSPGVLLCALLYAPTAHSSVLPVR